MDISPVEFTSAFGVPMEIEISAAASNIAELTNMQGAYTLNVIALAHGEDFCIQFIKCHLVGINSYTNKRMMAEEQMNELAARIMNGYKYINQYELCLFFARLKDGRYGSFYGSVDPQDIMTSLSKFCEERNADIDIYEREKQKNVPKNGITLAEYLKTHPEAKETMKLFGIKDCATDEEINQAFKNFVN